MFKIKNIIFDNNIVLAPMAGITDDCYRTIIKQHHCGLICCEMVSDLAINYKNEKTLEMLKFDEQQRPITKQNIGSEPQDMAAAVKYIESNVKPDIIDINFGCPVRKVAINKIAGSALLKYPQKIYAIVKACVESTSIPITAKIRLG
jgi:tRNA-dihydrouridine synthase